MDRTWEDHLIVWWITWCWCPNTFFILIHVSFSQQLNVWSCKLKKCLGPAFSNKGYIWVSPGNAPNLQKNKGSMLYIVFCILSTGLCFVHFQGKHAYFWYTENFPALICDCSSFYSYSLDDSFNGNANKKSFLFTLLQHRVGFLAQSMG
jgi:hypothetical protein